jgi:hypothetical protein
LPGPVRARWIAENLAYRSIHRVRYFGGNERSRIVIEIQILLQF